MKLLYVGWGLRPDMPSTPEQNYCREMDKQKRNFDVMIAEPQVDKIDGTEKEVTMVRKDISSYDVVHANHCGNPLAFEMLKLAKEKGVTTVFTPHLITPEHAKKFYEYADALVVFSKAEVVNHIKAGYSGKLFVNPNGLHLPMYEHDGALCDKKFNVLYVGQIDEFKGIFELQDACRELKIPLTVVTQATPMLDRFNKKRTNERVYIKPSFKELVANYHKANVLVLPTKWDTYPTVILEAYACGLPVLATEVGGIPEMVYKKYLFSGLGNLKQNIKDKLSFYKSDLTPYTFKVYPTPIEDCVNNLFKIYETISERTDSCL